MESPIRINKYLADHGYATRRGADALIAAGRVRVNGKPAVIGQKIQSTDRVEVSGGDAARKRYVLYYKPAGILTQAEKDSDTEDLLRYAQKKNGLKDLFPIGRLDKDTEGLIILTNDGRLTGRLSGAESMVEQEYEVTVDKRVTGTFLNRLKKGVRLGTHMTGPADVAPLGGNDHAFTIALLEGRKYHIRRMCAALGFAVISLKRIRIGSLELRSLAPGMFHELSGKEITALYAVLGLK